VTEHRKGFWFGFAAYLGWGVFPLYWPLLKPASATEILAHRIVWSLLFVTALVLILSRLDQLRSVVDDRRRLGFISVGAIVLAVNWGTYIYGVNSDHVVETSLGYFINPLVTVFLGVFVLGERLRRVQWVAIAMAALAVLQLTYDYGRPPWIALVLAFSFGTYGLMKKQAGVGATTGLTVETVILAPVALTYLLIEQARGAAAFGHQGWGHAALLVATGVVTAIPLLLFGASATRIPLTTLGLLQYVAPMMQFALGLLVFHEQMTPAGWFGFGLVWLALVVLTSESLLNRRRSEASRQLEVEPTAA